MVSKRSYAGEERERECVCVSRWEILTATTNDDDSRRSCHLEMIIYGAEGKGGERE